MADANKADLSDFLIWYNQAGTPRLDARLTYSEASKSARLTLSQSYPAGPDGAKRKPVPMPVKLGLVDSSGKDLPLRLDGKPVKDGLVVLRKKKEVFAFDGIEIRPMLSVLRDFSAPVSLNTSLSDREMLMLLRADSDLFNRWQTAQAFALKHLAAMTAATAKGEALRPNTRFIAALGEVASDESLEHSYRANFLSLPSEHDIALAIGTNVDPEAVHTARQTLRAALGRGLRRILETVYTQSAAAEPYRPDPESAGRRALRHAALALLAAGGSRLAAAKAKEQAKGAANMTETMAALSILSHIGNAGYDEALQRFYRRWKDEALVMNKWFALQASSPSPGTLDRIPELTAHPLFSMKNPNRARSVFGAFAHSNQVRFNDASGRGYELVADAVIELDSFNPQIASQLLGAFESWRMYEPKRQALAEAALKRVLAKGGLSSDVFEIATKIVGGERASA
jgi:aminopeptidase N